MRLGERIARETLDLSPYLPRHGFGITLLPAVAEKLLLDALEFPPGAKLARHAATQDVGLGQVETGEVVGHFDHVLLVYHHPVGFFHELAHHGMNVLDAVRMVMALDIFAHHARSGHAGPYDGTCRHQRDVIVAAEFVEQHAHGRRFDIEAAHAAPFPEQAIHFRVCLELAGAPDIDFDAPGSFHEFDGVLDVSQAALAEDVELVNAQILGPVHVEMRDRKALGRQIGGCVRINGQFGDQHATRMDRQILGHILNALGVAENEPGEFVPVAVFEGMFYEHVDFVFGQTEDFAELTDHGTPLESVECGQ